MIEGTIPVNSVNLSWVGWTSQSVSSGTAVAGIHHPDGAYKRISFGTTQFLPNGCAPFNHTNVEWYSGVTEPGSSGSGLFLSSTGQLVGQLHCGDSSCSSPSADDAYGSFSVTYPNISGLLQGGSDDSKEENDVCTAAYPLSTGTYSGMQVKYADEDWFALSVPTCRQLNIAASFTHDHGDIDIQLYETCGGALLGTSAGTGNSETLSWSNTGAVSEIVYLRVYLFDDVRNEYTLSVGMESIPAPACAPTSVVASDDLCDRIRVTWSWSCSGQTGFKVYRDGSLAHTGTSASERQWDDTGVAAGTTHNYYVKAYNGCGEGSPSNSDNGTRLTVPACAPTSVVASDDLCDRIRVTWSWSCSGQTGFKVYRDGSLAHTGTSASERQWDDTGVAAGTTHNYYVKAYNGCGEGSPSNSDNGTRLTVPACAPTSVVASDDLCDRIRVTWSWSCSGQTGFKVYRDGSLAHTGTSASERQWDDTGVTAGEAHDYYVCAYYTCGDGPASDSDTGSLLQVLPPPALMTPPDGESCTSPEVCLEWSSEAGATYEVQVGTSCGTGTISPESSTIYCTFGLTVGGTYFWRVRSVNACDDPGPWSECRSFEVGNGDYLNGTLQASASQDLCEEIEISWSWDHPQGVSPQGFRIYQTNVMGTYEIGDVGADIGSFTTPISLNEVKLYFWPSFTVSAYGCAGEGPEASAGTGHAIWALEQSPAAVRIDTVPCQGLKFVWRWTFCPPISPCGPIPDEFEVYRNDQLIHTTAEDAVLDSVRSEGPLEYYYYSYSDLSPIPGTNHYYALGSNGCGPSGPSATLSGEFVSDDTTFSLIATEPPHGSLGWIPSAGISCTFELDVDLVTITPNTVQIRGSQSGPLEFLPVSQPAGVIHFELPDSPIPGEIVSVTLTSGIEAEAGCSLFPPGSWWFSSVTIPLPPELYPRSILPSAPDPSSLVAGDFDDDGSLDLAVTFYDADSLCVLLGEPSGEFSEAYATTVGDGPEHVETGDLDGDGVLDLVLANELDGTVDIRFGTGYGAFGDPLIIPLDDSPIRVVLLDTNLDGTEDIVTLMRTSDTSLSRLAVILNAQGGFVVQSPVDVSGYATDMAALRGGADSFIDICISTLTPDAFLLFASDGAGGFELSSTTPSSVSPKDIAIADLTDDGLDDVVAVGLGPGVEILVNEGGDFTSQTSQGPYYNPLSVETADMDGQGEPDVLISFESCVTMGCTRGVVARLNPLTAPLDRYFYMDGGFGGTWLAPIAAGDFDGDESLDLVVASRDPWHGEVYILGTTDLAPVPPLSVTNVVPLAESLTWTPQIPIVIEFDADIDPATVNATTVPVKGDLTGNLSADYTTSTNQVRIDVLDSPHSGEPVEVLVTTEVRGVGGGQLQVPYQWQFHHAAASQDVLLEGVKLLETLDRPTALTVLDADADGDQDLAIALSGRVELLLNTNGVFSQGSTTDCSGIVGLAVADLNGDGFTDLASADWTTDGFTVFTNDGTGAFQAAFYPVGDTPAAIEVADFNGDGRTDIALSLLRMDEGSGAAIAVILNEGATFEAPVILDVDDPYVAIDVLDVEGNGTVDIVASTLEPLELRVFTNDGTGEFTAGAPASLTMPVIDFESGDLNGDGLADLVAIDGWGGWARVLLNQGGSFVEEPKFETGFAANRVSVADVDGQGDLDFLVATDSPYRGVYCVLNPMVPAEKAERHFPVSTDAWEPRMVVPLDVDGDGKLELAFAIRGSGQPGSVWILQQSGIVGVGDDAMPEPQAAFVRVFPNPTTNDVQISYGTGRSGAVQLWVADVQGRVIRMLRPRVEVEAGMELSLSWDGRDDNGAMVGSGVYFLVLHHPDGIETRKVFKLK